MRGFTQESRTTAFAEYRELMWTLIRKNLSPLRHKRYTHEDILSMTEEAAVKTGG